MGPELEMGGVLYTDKSYTFSYNPYSRFPEPNSFQFPWVDMIEIAVDGSRSERKRLAEVSIEHTFTKPGSYEVRGAIVYYIEKGVPFSSGWYETYYRINTYEVVDALAIVGSDTVDWNADATYGVTILLDGATFNGWSISPSAYKTTGSLNSRDLTVKFTDCLNYTITANFTKPDGTPYIATKQVSVRPTKPEITVHASKLSEQEAEAAGLGRSSSVYWVSTMPILNMEASPAIPSATYKWRSYDRFLFEPREGRKITLDMPTLSPPYNHHRGKSNRYCVECVVYANGQYSQPTTVTLFASRLRPGTPDWESRALEETEEDEWDIETDESEQVETEVTAE